MSLFAQLRHLRIVIIAACLAVFLLISFYLTTQRPSRTTPIHENGNQLAAAEATDVASDSAALSLPSTTSFPSPPGPVSTPVDGIYTRTVVIAKLEEEDASWIDPLVAADPHLASAVYIVDNANASLTVPQNKGHEVMVYLTYIIDHYFNLSDVTIFMHAHQFTWHNNDFLNSDSALIIKRLKSETVQRNGYMNIRCHLEPGCPDHIHPTVSNDDVNVPEAAIFGNAWKELLPQVAIPKVLSQPCCGQFAVSAERLQKIPLRDYIAYREWLLATPLEDRLSGRVWEYLWQWLFAGQEEFCPDEQTCYCEGYGVCFEPGKYKEYYYLRTEARALEKKIDEMKKPEEETVELSVEEEIRSMKDKIDILHEKMEVIKKTAAGDLS